MISAARYGSDCTSSMVTQKRMSLLGKPWTRKIPSAAPHNSSMMNSSSRASEIATQKP